MSTVIEATETLTTGSQSRNRQADEIARDLALMDELEALVQSLPDHRAAAGIGPLSDNAVQLVYEEQESTLL